MKISVVITTYNGEKYIADQLKSIKNQTCNVDEVLISDDGSTDNTIELIKKFIKKYNLKNWKFRINEKNLGWQTNFYQTIKRTSGDLIFLADQDDIWYSSKVEEMRSQFRNNSKIILLASSYYKIDAIDNIIKKNVANSGKLKKLEFNEQFYLTKYPGCVLAFTKDMIPYMDDLFFSKYSHDQLLWNIAILLDRAYLYEKPLIMHRIHAESATANNRNKTKRLDKIKSEEIVGEKLYNAIESGTYDVGSQKKEIVNQFNVFVKNRRKSLEKFNLKSLLVLIKYRKFYPRKRTIFGDLLFSLL